MIALWAHFTVCHYLLDLGLRSVDKDGSVGHMEEGSFGRVLSNAFRMRGRRRRSDMQKNTSIIT